MSEEELQQVLRDNIEAKFKEHCNRGLMAGWDSCIYELSKQIAHMTSAKAIKDFIKAKVGEADIRMEQRNNA